MRAAATGALLAFFEFTIAEPNSLPREIVGRGFGNRGGQYAPSFAASFRDFTEFSEADSTSRFKRVSGIDVVSGNFVELLAGSNARIVNAVSGAVVRAGDQAKVKSALGIRGSLFGLQSSDPDLNVYDAETERQTGDAARIADAERFTSANVRALALARAISLIGGNGRRQGTTVPRYSYDPIGDYLRARAGNFLFTNVEMSALIGSSPQFSTLRPDITSAIARLINAYAAAVPVRLAANEQIARFVLGIEGYLVPEIEALIAANGNATNAAIAASAALAVTTTDILTSTSRYAEYIPVDATTGFFFPVPDFETINVDETIIAPFTPAEPRFALTNNDQYAGTPFDSGFGWSSGVRTTIVSVSVPVANSLQVSVELRPDQTVVIRGLNGYRGVTYFDYLAAHQSGERKLARVYVRMR